MIFYLISPKTTTTKNTHSTKVTPIAKSTPPTTISPIATTKINPIITTKISPIATTTTKITPIATAIIRLFDFKNLMYYNHSIYLVILYYFFLVLNDLFWGINVTIYNEIPYFLWSLSEMNCEVVFSVNSIFKYIHFEMIKY